MFSYVLLNDSRVVANSELAIGAATLNFSDVDFGLYGVEQRKVLVGVGFGVDCAYPSPSSYSLEISSKTMSFEVVAQASPCLVVSGNNIAITSPVIPAGSYTAKIDVFLDIPLQQLEGEDAPEYIRKSFQYSQVLTVLVSIAECGKRYNHTQTVIQKPVYDGYGQFGFLLANLTAMDDFLKQRYGARDIDLIEEFTTTELANDLFDQGLMVLVWGLTSWHYFIFALSCEREKYSLPNNSTPEYKGCYKLSSGFDEFSVVRGEELSSWHRCKEKTWPIVSLPGVGEKLNVEFHIKRFNPVGGSHGPAYPIIVMWRSEGFADLSPILEADIDNAE